VSPERRGKGEWANGEQVFPELWALVAQAVMCISGVIRNIVMRHCVIPMRKEYRLKGQDSQIEFYATMRYGQILQPIGKELYAIRHIRVPRFWVALRLIVSYPAI
jgi:hypothetical protein